MENLFYSEKEKIAFYITPGYWCDNTDNVSEFIKLLEKERLKFAKMIKMARLDSIKSHKIDVSRRYKEMRVFYVEMDERPEGAFSIGFKETEETKGLREIPDPLDSGRLKYQWTINEWLKG